jgi:hypothetical protein
MLRCFSLGGGSLQRFVLRLLLLLLLLLLLGRTALCESVRRSIHCAIASCNDHVARFCWRGRRVALCCSEAAIC